jgi:hypothetical protein
MKPPNGTPLAMPLAVQMMSGSTPQCSIAHQRPVRPMPVCTSSAISKMPCLSHNSRKRGKKLAGGTT